MSAVIRDTAGRILAIATPQPGADPGTVLLRSVRGKGRLLGYYFGRGGRSIRIEYGLFTLPGTLSTRWLGNEREWAFHMPAEGRAS